MTDALVRRSNSMPPLFAARHRARNMTKSWPRGYSNGFTESRGRTHMQHRRGGLTGTGSEIHKTCAPMIAQTILALCVGALGRAQTITPPNGQQDHSSRIHE